MRHLLLLALTVLLAVAADKEKKPTQFTVEENGVRVLVSTKKVGKFEAGQAKSFILLYLRIDNGQTEELLVDYKRLYLRTPSGRSLQTLTGEEAVARVGWFMQAVVSSSMSGRRVSEATTSAEMNERVFPSRPVPPSTYREGLLVFEGSGSRREPLELFLPGILSKPIALSF